MNVINAMSKGVLGIILVFFIALTTIIHGLVLVKLWAWFITPYFGLPAITVPVAIGLSLILGMLCTGSDDLKTETKIATILTNSNLNSLITLFVGWIVTFFLG